MRFLTKTLQKKLNKNSSKSEQLCFCIEYQDQQNYNALLQWFQNCDQWNPQIIVGVHSWIFIIMNSKLDRAQQ